MSDKPTNDNKRQATGAPPESPRDRDAKAQPAANSPSGAPSPQPQQKNNLASPANDGPGTELVAEGTDLEADDEYDSAFGAVSDGDMSDTASLTSSLRNSWLSVNGRRYHTYYGRDKNLMPSDEAEQERLDIHHAVMKLICDDRLYFAPLNRPHRVLDVGTGTGVWAVEFAELHPESEVIGVDLTPIQPGLVFPNLRFETDDIEMDWTYPKESFDYIHIRNISHSLKDWPRLLAQVMEHLKPGGYVELSELGSALMSDDDSIPSDWPPKIIFEGFVQALNQLGRVVPTQEFLSQAVTDAGFDLIQATSLKHPLGPWARKRNLKEAGALVLLMTETGYEAYGMAPFTRILGWSHEDASDLFRRCNTAHWDLNAKVHAYYLFHKVVAQKRP